MHNKPLITTLIAMALLSSTQAQDVRTAAAAKVKLHTARLALLAEKYRDVPNYYPVKAWETAQLEMAMAALATGKAPAEEPGFALEAYISDIDNSAQPFWVYVPKKKVDEPGLLVDLHGYSSTLDQLLQPKPGLPLTDIADKTGAYVVAPFARGNTDYQHIGEADVLRVIDEMAARHAIDRDKIVLAGASMGGLGCWCIGSRNAHLFNAIVIFCGRGDFYVWHKLKPSDIPSWQREIVDKQFATQYLPNLTNTQIVAAHGLLDDIVTYEQGEFPVKTLRKLGSDKIRFVSFPHCDHVVFLDAIADSSVTNLLIRGLSEKFPRIAKCDPAPKFRGDAGSRTMNALLSPFLMVSGADYSGNGYSNELFKARVREWEDFGHGTPRSKNELQLTMRDVTTYNLFCFGEPEYSYLIAALLKKAGVSYTKKAFSCAGKTMPRDDRHGFLIAMTNPYNTNLTAVVQCGLPWATEQSPNHRFDRIPDVICYNDDTDMFGYPVAEAAGFIDDDGKVRWSPNPFTEAIRKVEIDYGDVIWTD